MPTTPIGEKVSGCDIRCLAHPYYNHNLSTDNGRVCRGRPHLLTGVLKVKVNLELATKAQKGNRVMALLFL